MSNPDLPPQTNKGQDRDTGVTTEDWYADTTDLLTQVGEERSWLGVRNVLRGYTSDCHLGLRGRDGSQEGPKNNEPSTLGSTSGVDHTRVDAEEGVWDTDHRQKIIRGTRGRSLERTPREETSTETDTERGTETDTGREGGVRLE